MNGQITEGQQVDPTPEDSPVDLASAFRKLKAENNEPAKEPVSDPNDGSGASQGTGGTEGQEDTEPQGSPVSVDPVDTSGAQVSAVPDPVPQASDGDYSTGGSVSIGEEIDLPGTRDGLRKEIRNQAIQLTNQKFQEANIKKIQIDDLYQRDENTGAVEFINPDNPNRPFDSRYEAQQWVDAFNKQIDDRFNREATKAMNEIAENQRPMFELLDFVPEYEKMSKIEQEVFDELIEPYGITNGRGEVVGFNVNLSAAANQARSIAKRFYKEEPVKQAQNVSKEPSTPAMDPKTSGSGTANTGKKQPKNLNEAFKMLKEKEKGKK